VLERGKQGFRALRVPVRYGVWCIRDVKAIRISGEPQVQDIPGKENRMPWETRLAMSLKKEFTSFAEQEGADIRALCRRFGICPATGYKWLRRYRSEGEAGLAERSASPWLANPLLLLKRNTVSPYRHLSGQADRKGS
jgi:transposase-like protein